MKRVEKAMNNIIANLVINCLNILMQFISRTVFIYVLGIKYLGINGLFSSVLTILNLAELGIGSAILYSLYEPLAENNIGKIKALMAIYKKCYKYIGGIVLLLGVIIIPLLPYIVPMDNLGKWIYGVYILFLLQTVFSYWFLAYRLVLIEADQRSYLLGKLHCLINLSTTIIKLFVLIIFHSFIVYIAIGVVSQVIHNVLAARKVTKLYPYLLEESTDYLTTEELKKMKRNVVGLSMYKISGTVLTSTDNIIISIFLGVSCVGIVDNYTMIIKMVLGVLMILFGSYTSGIGNLYVTESKERVEYLFRCLNFANFWLYGFCSICIYILINPFITLWIGARYTVPGITVFIIFLNLITSGLQNAVISFKDGCGLYWEGKFRPLISAFLNLLFSLLLVKPLGIAGVVLGTIISRFLTTWWFDPLLIYRHAFHTSPRAYYWRYMQSLAIIIVTALGIRSIQFYLLREVTLLNFVLLCLVCIVIPNIIFWIYARNSKEYEYFLVLIKKGYQKIIDKMSLKRRRESGN